MSLKMVFRSNDTTHQMNFLFTENYIYIYIYTRVHVYIYIYIFSATSSQRAS